MKMPSNFRLIRVMCIGRINQALILRAFEYGADGVILLECNDEDCRYGPGPEVGHENVQRVRKLLHLLGIGQERLVEWSFGAHEKEELVGDPVGFCARHRTPGADHAGAGLAPRRGSSRAMDKTRGSTGSSRNRSLYQCLECGKCTASCPRRLTGKEYSPRLLAHKVIAEREDESLYRERRLGMPDLRDVQRALPLGGRIQPFILEMRDTAGRNEGLEGLPGPRRGRPLLDEDDDRAGAETEPARLGRERPPGGLVRRGRLLSSAAPPISTSSFPASRWIPFPSRGTASGS